jgi:hypothetical protein
MSIYAKRRIVALGALVVAVVVFTVAPASASPPMPAAGTVAYVPVFTPDKVAGGNTFLIAMNPGTVTGTFAGTALTAGTLKIFEDGSFNFAGRVTFEGTVAGCGEGTVVYQIEGAGYLLGGVVPVFTRQNMHTLVGQGTLPVHSNVDLLGIGTTLNYSGTYHC